MEYIADVVSGSSRLPATCDSPIHFRLHYWPPVQCATSLKTSRKHTIKLEDLRRALSRPADSKKLARMEELLFMQEDIKRARAQFDPADESVAKEMGGEAELREEEEKPGKGKEKQRS